MKNKTPHSGKGIFLAAAGMIASGAVLFGGLSEVVLAAESQKVAQIPTSYSLTVLPEPALPQADSPAPEMRESHETAGYTIEKGDFEGTPAEKDISMEKAAETGAQEIRKVYGAELDNAVITMKYFPATKYFPRAYWYGAARPAGEKASLQNPGISEYQFTVDAMTGTVLCSQVMRFIDGPELSGFNGFDRELSKDPFLYTERAKELAESLNLFEGKIKSVEYSSQGYLNNDPNATISLTGEDGRRAKLGISRHDQTLVGIQYEEWMVYSDLGSEALREDIRIEEQRLIKELEASGEIKTESGGDDSHYYVYKSDASPLQ